MAINTDELPAWSESLARAAITEARITGSTGATHIVESWFGVQDFVQVERVQLGHSGAWRVVDASIDGIVGAVLVAEGNSGQFASHGRDDGLDGLRAVTRLMVARAREEGL